MKQLGQYFLKNKTAIRKIITALDLEAGETVIEVGPGYGELTLELAKQPAQIIAIEKDWGLAQELESRIKNQELKVIGGDALKILPSLTSNLKSNPYKLVGNIPYYITGRLLRLLSELDNKPILTVFTLQKEVAERIVAQPPKMNRLAAIVQFWAAPKILFHISPKAFSPRPKVYSSVIKFKMRREELKVKEGDYYRAVRILFQQPRKTITNNLKPKTLNFKLLGLTGRERPQNLDIDTLIKISDMISE